MKRILALVVATTLFGGVRAACTYENTVPVNSLSAGFDAWKVVTDAMAECGAFKADLDQEFQVKQAAAFASNPSQYTMGGVSLDSITPLLSQNLIRPLDSLVEQYGQDLLDNQKIVIDGKIMAVAMMINSQHLMYRTDVFDDLGIAVPTTYEEVLAAAEKIQSAGVVDYPLGGTYMSGWNLGLEFVNMYLSLGGNLLNEDNTPAVNNETGTQTLEMLKKLSAYMNPEFLTSDSTYVQQQFQQGQIAMANLWASRAGAMNDPAESQVVGKIGFAAAPRAKADGSPATTLWWDGMVIANNATDEQAEAVFRLFMEGTNHDVLAANPDSAIWLTNPSIESDIAKGTLDSAAEGAPTYPASAAAGMLHTALGNNIADFFRGSKSAEATLEAVESEYQTAAREAGLIN